MDKNTKLSITKNAGYTVKQASQKCVDIPS